MTTTTGRRSEGWRGVAIRPASWIRVAVVSLALGGALVAGGGVRLGAEPGSAPRLDWIFDGTVTGAARISNTLYVGGWFTSVVPRAGELGRLFTLSPSTGALVAGTPMANGMVQRIASDGAGGYYVSGLFTNLGNPAGLNFGGGPSQERIAHVLASGQVDPAFFPQVGGQFFGMLRVGPSLVVTGRLYINGGATGRAVVALDPATGALSSWTPALPGAIYGLAASGGAVFVATSDGAGAKRVSAFDGATGGVLWTSAVLGGPTAQAGPIVVAGSRLVVGLERLYALDPASGAVDASWGSAATGVPVGQEILSLAVSGTAIHIAGSFTSFGGQARGNLAAVDVATGALLPWAPQASAPVASLSASPNGGVFALASKQNFGPFATINGQQRTSGVFEIDPAGSVTSWNAAATFIPTSLYAPATGPIVFGSVDVATVGNASRAALAAIDVTSGALGPAVPTVGSVAGGAAVTSLVSVNQTLYLSGLFDSVNGQPRANIAAVDAATNTLLPWPATAVPTTTTIAIAHDVWVYVYLDATGPLRRIHAVTGQIDPAFQVVRPFGGLSFAVGNGRLYIGVFSDAQPNAPRLLIHVIDPATDTLRYLISVPASSAFAVTGDTVYLASPVRSVATDIGTISAYDLRTGVRVAAPAVSGQLNGISVADGRLFAYGGTVSSGGSTRMGAAEVVRPAGFTAWDTGAWRLDNADSTIDRGVFDVRAHGNLLVTLGLHDSFPTWRVVAHDLSGTSVPSNLRVQETGQNTIFSWDPMALAPAGGYVIEGGFAPGQTAGALAVGNATSVALPMPAGPIFLRVRPQGSSEVSNEIVAGCAAPPLPPTALTTTLSGINLTLAWTAPTGSVTGYTLLAGTASGSSNAATLALGPATSVGGQVPGGTFFARVTASNACGTSGPSGEVFFTIGAPDPLPAAPTNVTSSVSGSTLTLSWTAPPGPVTGYVLEAGTAPGLANTGAATIGASTSFVIPGVPPGTYYVRVRAITSAGSGAPSTDVTVTLP